MDLRSTQLKDTYGNLVTTGTTEGSPTSGGLQNGDGTLLTSVGIGTNSPSNATHIYKNASIGNPTSFTAANAGLRVQDNFNSMYFDGNAIISDGAGNFELGTTQSSELILYTNATEAMRIDSSGNVLINKTTGTERLDVNGNVQATSFIGSGASLTSLNASNISSGTLADARLSSNVALKDVDNNFSVGQTINGNLTVDNTLNSTIRLNASDTTILGGDSIGTIEWYSNDPSSSGTGVSAQIQAFAENDFAGGNRNTSIAFSTVLGTGTLTERMRIDSSGRLLVGTETALDGFSGTAQRACFSAIGDVMTVNIGTGTSAYTGIHVLRQSSNGKVLSFERNSTDVGSISVTTTATAYNTSSDYRLKENITPLEGALEKIAQLKPSTFNFKSDAESTVSGFIAHEIQEVVPEAVTGEKDGMTEYEVTPAVFDEDGNVIEEAVMGKKPIYQGIDQSKIVPLLVGAIQELKAEIEQLKAK